MKFGQVMPPLAGSWTALILILFLGVKAWARCPVGCEGPGCCWGWARAVGVLPGGRAPITQRDSSHEAVLLRPHVSRGEQARPFKGLFQVKDPETCI